MENRKELPTNNNDKHRIKLFEEHRSIITPLALELMITKCPLSCDNCKTIYSNKLTGIKIRCICVCHDKIFLET
jgi:hypothetical protein